MAREYDPAPKPPEVRVRFSRDKRKIGDRKVTVHTASCLEDGYRTTGDTEAEAARYFAAHLTRVHPRQTVRKV